MTATRAQAYNVLIWPYSAVAIMCYVLRPDAAVEVWLMRGLAIAITMAHVHYGVCVVSDRDTCKSPQWLKEMRYAGKPTVRPLPHQGVLDFRSYSSATGCSVGQSIVDPVQERLVS